MFILEMWPLTRLMLTVLRHIWQWFCGVGELLWTTIKFRDRGEGEEPPPHPPKIQYEFYFLPRSTVDWTKQTTNAPLCFTNYFAHQLQLRQEMYILDSHAVLACTYTVQCTKLANLVSSAPGDFLLQFPQFVRNVRDEKFNYFN